MGIGSPQRETVAEHRLVAPGEASVLDEHYGGPRLAPRRAVRPKTVVEKQFCALGPVAQAFITGAAAAGNTRLGSELAELSGLQAAHGTERCWPLSLSFAHSTRAGAWRRALARGTRAQAGRNAGPVHNHCTNRQPRGSGSAGDQLHTETSPRTPHPKARAVCRRPPGPLFQARLIGVTDSSRSMENTQPS